MLVSSTTEKCSASEEEDEDCRSWSPITNIGDLAAILIIEIKIGPFSLQIKSVHYHKNEDFPNPHPRFNA